MYGKHFQSMYTGSMYGVGADIFAVWGYVIAHAGKEGVLDLNPRYVAPILGMTAERVTLSIDFLCLTDPKSRSKKEEGRRLIQEGQYQYRVPNAIHYGALKSLEEKRAADRQRQTKHRMSQNVTPDVTLSHTQSQKVAHVDIDVDVDINPEEKSKRRASALPPNFELTESMKEFARGKNLDPVETFEAFRDYWLGAGTPKKDWSRVWQTWCRRQPEFKSSHPPWQVGKKLSLSERVRLANPLPEDFIHDR